MANVIKSEYEKWVVEGLGLLFSFSSFREQKRMATDIRNATFRGVQS